MWFAISVIVVLLLIVLIREFTKEDSNNPDPDITNRLKDEQLISYFTPKVNVRPGDSVNDDGVRSLRERILNDTIAEIIYDEFKKESNVILARVAGNDFSFMSLYTTIGNSEIVLLFLSFGYAGGSYGITCISCMEKYHVSKGTTIYFIFEDGASFEYTFEYDGQPWQEESLMNHIGVHEDIIRMFADKKLNKWRLYRPGGIICIGDLTKNIEYYDKPEAQYTIRKMAQTVITTKQSIGKL